MLRDKTFVVNNLHTSSVSRFTGGLSIGSVNDRACLVVLPDGEARNPDAILEAARSSGVDPNRLRIQLHGRALAAAARGSAKSLAAAAQALLRAGLVSTVVTDAEAHALPPLQSAGGVWRDGERLSLLVHGRPYGPPAGVALLFVFADLGRSDRAPNPADQQPAGSFRQQLLRATLPVVDVVWTGGRVRVSLRSMTWRGLSRRSLSGADNLIQVLGTLAHDATGTVVDSGFMGQDLAVQPPQGMLEPLEGIDRDRSALFDRYSATAALAWERGIYPAAASGQVAPVGGAATRPAGVCEARAFFSAPAPARSSSEIPWIRGGLKSHIRRSLWPWFAAPPFLTFWLFSRSDGHETVLFLGGIAFAVSGLVSIVVGFRSLAQRERVRAIPLSRVRSMSMGAVGLVGRVAAIASFKAPYSRAECVWYRFEVRQDRGDAGAGDSLYRTIEEGTSGDVPFLLRDDTGSVLVQPSGAEVDVDPETFPLDDRTRAIEWAVGVGAQVFVNGFAQRRSTDSSGPRPTVLPDRDDVFVGSGPDTPLTIAQKSRAEEVDRLSHRSYWPIAAGTAYLMVALLLWVSVRSLR